MKSIQPSSHRDYQLALKVTNWAVVHQLGAIAQGHTARVAPVSPDVDSGSTLFLSSWAWSFCLYVFSTSSTHFQLNKWMASRGEILDQWIKHVIWALSKPRNHPNNHCCLCKQCAGAQEGTSPPQPTPSRKDQGAAGCLGNPPLPLSCHYSIAHSPFFFNLHHAFSGSPHPPLIYTHNTCVHTLTYKEEAHTHVDRQEHGYERTLRHQHQACKDNQEVTAYPSLGL